MKRNISTWIAAIVFVGALSLASAQATTAPQATNKVVEITGCLQQGPAAKEYILQSNDGSTWVVTSVDRNMYMNDYVGQTVTVSGDAVHPSARLRTVSAQQNAPKINHYLRARDVAVVSETCKK